MRELVFAIYQLCAYSEDPGHCIDWMGKCVRVEQRMCSYCTNDDLTERCIEHYDSLVTEKFHVPIN